MLLGNLTPRNPSAEGSGHARSAWMAHIVQLLEDDDEPHGAMPSPFTAKGWSVSDEDRKRVATSVREFSEMIGFWVAWHSTGGFDRLEDNGWSRATIYRKISRFREHFGAHPDDYTFDWITIDQSSAWDAAILHALGADDEDES